MLFWRIHQEVLVAALLACACSCPVHPEEPPALFTPNLVTNPGKCDGLTGLFHHALLSGLISLPEKLFFPTNWRQGLGSQMTFGRSPPPPQVSVLRLYCCIIRKGDLDKRELYLRCCFTLQSCYNNVLGWVATKKLLSHGLKLFIAYMFVCNIYIYIFIYACVWMCVS